MVSQCTLSQPVAFQWHSSVHWTSQCTLAQGKGIVINIHIFSRFLLFNRKLTWSRYSTSLSGYRGDARYYPWFPSTSPGWIRHNEACNEDQGRLEFIQTQQVSSASSKMSNPVMMMFSFRGPLHKCPLWNTVLDIATCLVGSSLQLLYTFRLKSYGIWYQIVFNILKFVISVAYPFLQSYIK